ncbi:MAG: DUF433 domain-containing protein [Desulfobacteraceae bacterium IS3]|nr:MAG: DUF433 domain-containing protein [Desulfobacteraceae bacterium IS3]
MIETVNDKSAVIRSSRGLSIEGTRITLYQIMDFLKAGYSPEMIRDDFRLTVKQTADVVKYIETHKAEVESEYQQVVRDAEAERQYWEEHNRERLSQIAKMPLRPGQEQFRAKLRSVREKPDKL